MLWSRVEFAREVHRQLVELESIRKRHTCDPELLERLDRIEASQQFILRKLLEASTPEAVPGGSATPPPSTASEDAVSEDAGTCGDDGDAARERSPIPRRGVKNRAGRCNSRAGADSSRGAVGGSASCPTVLRMATPPLAIDETCAVCGRLLFTALLGGRRLVRMGQAWYHAECVHPEDGNDADATGSQAEMGSEN